MRPLSSTIRQALASGRPRAPVRTGARPLVILAALAVGRSADGTAVAAPPPPGAAAVPYPSSLALAAVNAWLRTAGSDDAALVTARSAYVRSPGAGTRRLVLDEETLTPDAARVLGGRSARLVFGLDCEGRAARLESAEAHSSPALGGAGRPLSGDAWRRADPGFDLDDVVLLGCGPPGGSAPASPSAGSAPAASGAAEGARAKGAKPVVVQIGAFSADAGAAAAFEALRAAFPDETKDLSVSLAPTGSAGRLRRALMGPFGGRLDAEAFCAKATAHGFACFVRRDGADQETTAPWPSATSPAPSTSPILKTTPQGTSP